MHTRWIAAALAAFAVVTAPASVRAQELGLKVGTAAPTVAPLETIDGKAADLGSYVGKGPVLFEFWAAWCENCKALEPQMIAAAKKYAGKIKFVGVAVSINQSQELAKRYAEKHQLPGDILYDRKGIASDEFGAPATSYIVILDAKGKVVYTGLGADQKIDDAIRKAL
jgi:thiol-disulfide isomerase/thioredoxin